MSYANGNRPPIDDDDVEEEALVADYQEQVNNYEEGTDLTRADSLTGGPADLRAQLEAAAAPLEYQASLETKFASYDNYCSLFHYILNSDGPVEIEQPSYYWAWDVIDGMLPLNIEETIDQRQQADDIPKSSSISSNPSAATATVSQGRHQPRKRHKSCEKTQIPGAAIPCSMSYTR